MSKGSIKVVIPRNNPVDAYTMAAIVRDAGLTIEQFKELSLSDGNSCLLATPKLGKGGSAAEKINRANCSAKFSEYLQRGNSIEQAGHCHSPRTRCCHANGSSGNRTVPATLAKSVGALFSCSPFTRAARK